MNKIMESFDNTMEITVEKYSRQQFKNGKHYSCPALPLKNEKKGWLKELVNLSRRRSFLMKQHGFSSQKNC
jgi:hypothetical protein